GYEILKTIKKFNYPGKIFPVNPKADEILGFNCYHSISEITEQIDLAIIVVPKKFTLETIDELLEKNVKSIILITAGFKETGEIGKLLEEEIVNKIKSAGARLVGPNCMGVINTLPGVNLNTTFVAEKPEIGKIACLSQSGALGAMILNSLRLTDIRFTHFISVGNKADLNENDFIRFWQSDDNIEIITMYLESFDNGLEFIKLLMLNEVTKPIVVLKAGRTESGMRAASSHTGALSSQDKVVDGLLKQFGVIRVDNINELFNTAKGLESFPAPKGNRIAVVTNAGGPSILLVDKIEKERLQLAELSERTKSKLREVVHPEGTVNNPIDLLPSGNEETFSQVIKIVLNDDNVDAVISVFVEPVMVKPIPVAEAINEIESDKPVFQVIAPLPEFWDNYRKNSKWKKPIFKNSEDPAEVIANMLFYSQGKEKRTKLKSVMEKSLSEVGTGKFKFSSGFITQEEVNKIAKHYGLPLVKEILADAERIEDLKIDFYPIVIKGISKDVIHKSELDAVKLNIQNLDELKTAALQISERFKSHGYEVENFLIQEFIQTKHEILLGGYRDPSFGPVIMFGSGGKYVEVLDDTEIRSAFITEEEIAEMIQSTKIGKVLSGVRGERSVDLTKLTNIIKSASQMLIENEKIMEFDLNPLIVDTLDQFHAVDIRIKFGE
ncbi:MAG: acetyl-CoA synthetase, partial [Chlorobi bacterium]|nr:acetyl-CoA synthetase [Chlorobiota bacterium]